MSAPRRLSYRDLGPVPKGHCTWCRQPVKKPRRSWCGQACIDEYLIRSSPTRARSKTWERDGGCCQLCGLDVGALEQAKRDLVHRTAGTWRIPGTERYETRRRTQEQPEWKEAIAVMVALGYTVTQAWRSGEPLWNCDHIVPVSEGGGACGLDNLRTLCVPCHRTVTAQWRAQRAAERKAGPQLTLRVK